MKKSLSLFLIILLSFNSAAWAFDNGRIIEQKDTSYEYENIMYKISHILRVTNGNLVSTSDKLPRDTLEAHEYFEKVCAPKSSNTDLAKKVTVSYQGFLTTREFQCDERSDDTDTVSTVQFVVTVDRDENLKDLQINKLNAKAINDPADPHHMTLKDGGEILIAVAASTLVSGLLAKQIYTGEQDKFLHATGGSLIAAATTLLAYYGFKVSKNEAAIIGFATAVAVALLKEYAYDASHRDTHTVDIHDAAATSMGGAMGAFFVRFQFRF